MPAIIRDIIIEQGGVLDETFVLKQNGVIYDLTGYTSKMLFLKSDGTVAHEATTENGQIEISGVAGAIRRYIPATVTALMDGATVSYDWELTPPAGVAHTWKLYRGRCHVILEGSRGS